MGLLITVSMGLAACVSNPGQVHNRLASPRGATRAGFSGPLRPLDTASVRDRPCTALSDAQLSPVVGDETNRSSSPGSCSIVSVDESKPSVRVHLLPIGAGSWQALVHASPSMQVHQRARPIRGYPTVRSPRYLTAGTSASVDRPPSACSTMVAVSPHDAIEVDLDAGGESQQSSPFALAACKGSRQLAAALIGNLSRAT